ncbi:bifunctional glutamate/proline--tRNA ligase-like [Trifolium medium]|uniref:Bifunctional glutamate/proline--tRNA ligase-like n=1 Tax=Trifolium medium TaxID=97028 RepID=A0A392NE53_9FABA|nr:bifunctional glutamate/proline--tRNA ligase-like [Trifolium medium]
MGAAKIICCPFAQPELLEGTKCFASDKPAKKWTYWGRIVHGFLALAGCIFSPCNTSLISVYYSDLSNRPHFVVYVYSPVP